jgi:YlmC/YmxH family sporulation protein
MHMSDLQQKDIVSIKDGKRLGKIIDLIVNNEGIITYIVVDSNSFLKRYSFGSETNIKFSQIVRFGEDVILVDLSK